MSDNSANVTVTPVPVQDKTKDALIQSLQDCIAAQKLSITLLDEKIGIATNAAEIWKARYDNLEKQALELQSKYVALVNPQQQQTPAVQVD